MNVGRILDKSQQMRLTDMEFEGSKSQEIYTFHQKSET